jgi:VIT1/CCC1 family predicted Fe2+/Mn2+ transporter
VSAEPTGSAAPGASDAKSTVLDGASPPDLREAIFGSFDGMTSTLGVIAGLLATHTTAPRILAGAIGIAVAATVGMGAGQYLSEDQHHRSLRKAAVMALATLIGSILPALPFIFGNSQACVIASIAITALAATVIGHYRGYLVTFSILVVVGVITVGLSVAVA